MATIRPEGNQRDPASRSESPEGLFCSTIIPTIGRDTLERAVESVLKQTWAEASEVIVVNDSGRLLRTAPWQADARVRVINTNGRERSVARNTGAAAAHGRFLHFLDDDDWLAPGALQRLWQLAQERPAAWLYGSTQLVDRHGRALIQLHHRLNGKAFLPAMAGEWIPIQASLIASRPFFNLGGFNPLLQGPEDVDLLRRVALHYDIAGTEAVVAYVEWGEEGSTTNYEQHPEQSRRARERLLDAPGCFTRLRDSAVDAYWHGRVTRLYLTSLIWNLRRRRLLMAPGRAAYALFSLLLAGHYLFTPAFWQSVSHAYASPTFARGFREKEACFVQSSFPP
jgi:glycosyltransferase involved in cell wall biosynthesis